VGFGIFELFPSVKLNKSLEEMTQGEKLAVLYQVGLINKNADKLNEEDIAELLKKAERNGLITK
jgi:TusA-related sulfurtransferase